MIEMILLIAVLAVTIMAWGKISKSLSWAGNRIDETTDMLVDMTLSGRDQTARARLASRKTLEADALDFEKAAASRAKVRKEFLAKLDKDQKAEVDKVSKFANALLNR